MSGRKVDRERLPAFAEEPARTRPSQARAHRQPGSKNDLGVRDTRASGIESTQEVLNGPTAGADGPVNLNCKS